MWFSIIIAVSYTHLDVYKRQVYTLHAGGYVDENDWQMASFSTGTVQVNSGDVYKRQPSGPLLKGAAYMYVERLPMALPA